MKADARKATEGGDECVIVQVPSHGSEPVCSRADGPQDKGKSQGIRRATYYVRAPGPESVPIETPEQWSGIIRRCVRHERETLLSRIDQLLRGAKEERLIARSDSKTG